MGWNGEGRSGNAGWRSKKGRRELQRGAHGEVGHGGVAMAAAVARGCASRSSPRLLWASRRRRGAGHVGLGAGRAARAGRAAAAALGRTQLAPSDRRSVACAGGAERQRRPGRGECSSGVVMARRSEATAGRQQGGSRAASTGVQWRSERAAAARALPRAERGRESEGERERSEKGSGERKRESTF